MASGHNNKAIGKLGEDLAAEYLLMQGYTIIKRNFRCRTGEIDIIGKDNDYLVFIEVKTRKSNIFGLPCEAVDNHKKNKIIATSYYYIAKNKGEMANFQYRFDVIEVVLDENNKQKRINLIKNAFDAI